MLVPDKRYQVHVVVAPHDEDPFLGVSLRVRVRQDVEQISALDVEDDVLETDAAFRPELRVLRVVSAEQFHGHQRGTTCARKAHIGIVSSVPKASRSFGLRCMCDSRIAAFVGTLIR